MNEGILYIFEALQWGCIVILAWEIDRLRLRIKKDDCSTITVNPPSEISDEQIGRMIDRINSKTQDNVEIVEKRL